MSEDDDERLLRALGRFVRNGERDVDTARLERLCHDDLSGEERAQLEAAAARDAAAAERMRAHAPLSSAARAQIAAAVLATVRANETPLAAADEAGEAPAATSLPADRAAVRPRRVRALWVAGPLAAAAAVLLWLTTTPAPPGALPDYALEVAGAPAELRGAEPVRPARAPVRIGPSTRLTLVLRPATEVRADVRAAVFLSGADGEQVAWPGTLAPAPSGALRLSLAPSPRALTGPAEARVLVGRAELLQAEAAALARGEPERGPGFQRFVIELIPAEGN